MCLTMPGQVIALGPGGARVRCGEVEYDAATLLVPIVIAAARQAGFDPVPPALAAGLAATCGFIFPVSTPPNAIVFGTGRVPLTRMIRAGALLDVACVVIVWVGMQLLRPYLPHAG